MMIDKASGFDWANAPPKIKELVHSIVSSYRNIVGDNLVGFYLHGSLAMGCFNPLVSDIDFLAVVSRQLTIVQKKAIIHSLIGLSSHFPPKGVEMSIVLEKSVKNFAYPTPFELHYSQTWHERFMNEQVDYSKQSCDEDLAAHFVITKTRGICLYGKPITEVFPEIPAEIYAKSLLADAEFILKRAEGNPVYSILNLSRILAFFKGDMVASKKEGGEWALQNLPKKYARIIEWALAAYSGDGAGQPNRKDLNNFVNYIKDHLPT